MLHPLPPTVPPKRRQALARRDRHQTRPLMQAPMKLCSGKISSASSATTLTTANTQHVRALRQHDRNARPGPTSIKTNGSMQKRNHRHQGRVTQAARASLNCPPQGSRAPSSPKMHTLIPAPSPIREGISYLDATKTFIPPLPSFCPPDLDSSTHKLEAGETSTCILSVDPGKLNEGEHHSFDDKKESDRAAFSTTTALINAISIALFLLTCYTQRSASDPIWLWLLKGMILSFALISQLIYPDPIFKLQYIGFVVIITYAGSHVFRTNGILNLWMVMDRPTAVKCAFTVLMALIELFEEYQQEKYEQQADLKRQQKELRLAQQKLEEQTLKKKLQEDAKRRQELEELWRQAQQNTLVRIQVEAEGSSPPAIRYSSLNNHDDKKRKYDTQEGAEDVIARMTDQGFNAHGTLKSYYNQEYNKWFVGNGF